MRKSYLSIFLSLFCLPFLFGAINFYDTDVKQIEQIIEQQKNLLERIILLENYIRYQPEVPELYLWKGKSELSMKDYIGAEKTLSVAVDKFPDQKDFSYLLGMSYYHQRKYRQATAIFETLLQNNPKDQTATFFLSLLHPFQQEFVRKEKKTTEEQKLTASNPFDAEKIKELELRYLTDHTEDSSPYVYLYQQKHLDVKTEKIFHHQLEGALRINQLTDLDVLQNFPIVYDSALFHPVKIEAAQLNPNGSMKKIDEKQITIASNTKNSTFKNILIGYSNIVKGTILCYKIYFEPKNESVMPKFSDTFYWSGQTPTIQRNYSVTYPESVPVYFLFKPTQNEEMISDEQRNGNLITKFFSVSYPDLILLGDQENISILDISSSITATGYESWEEFGKWYASSFYGKQEKVTLPITLEKEKKKTIGKLHEYMQQQFQVTNSIKENYFLPKSSQETLESRSGAESDINHLFIDFLRQAGITAYPVLISTRYNGKVESYIPNPFNFNYILTYIPEQEGIETPLYLDPATKFLDYENLPFEMQKVNGLIVKDNGESLFVQTPMIPSNKNRMTESYVVTYNNIGNANFVLHQEITGSFAEYFRSQIAGSSTKKTGEVIDYFFRIQKEAFPLLEKEQISIMENVDYSKNFLLKFESTSSNASQVLFDGKQILTINLAEIKDWLSFPQEIIYPYRKNFAFAYEKKIEYIFPEGYEIVENDLRNIFRENEYFLFEFSSDKIAENHFSMGFRLLLKEIDIEPKDIPLLSQFGENLLQEVQFKVVMEKRENFDYEDFFEKLTKDYPQVDVYKNYLNRLLLQKKREKALKVVLKAGGLFPEESYFQLAAALIYFELGKYKETEQELLGLLEKASKDKTIYQYLSELYEKTEETEKQFQILSKAIEQFPEDPFFIGLLSTHYRTKNQTDDAILLLEEALKKPSMKDNEDFLVEIGYLYSKKKDVSGAESYLKRVIEINERNGIALNNLAWLYCENDIHLQEAVLLAEKACRLVPNNDGFLDTLAEAYYKTKQYDKAIETIKKAIKINPSYAYLEMQLKKIEEMKKRDQQATEDMTDGK